VSTIKLMRNGAAIRPPKEAAPPVKAGPPPPIPLKVAPAPLGRFFFLWRVDGTRPKQRHATLEGARAERDRLKAVSPGDYLIFEARRVSEDAT
jgi:hypothetical protein